MSDVPEHFDELSLYDNVIPPSPPEKKIPPDPLENVQVLRASNIHPQENWTFNSLTSAIYAGNRFFGTGGQREIIAILAGIKEPDRAELYSGQTKVLEALSKAYNPPIPIKECRDRLKTALKTKSNGSVVDIKAYELAKIALADIVANHHVVIFPNVTVIARPLEDGEVTFTKLSVYRELYANHMLEIPGEDEPMSIADMWFKDSHTRRLDGCTFDPGQLPYSVVHNKLNMWLGYAVTPTADTSGRGCQRFLDHLRYIICDNDEASYKYQMGYLAHMVQRPHILPTVACVYKSKEGSGKDKFLEYLRALYRPFNALHLTKSDSLTSNFNSILENKIMITVPEAMWAGDKSAENTLKALITEKLRTSERKGIDSYNVPSYIRLFLTSNEDWVVPVDKEGRRYFILNVSDKWATGNHNDEDKRAYMQAIDDELEAGGAASLLAYLQSYDITDFNILDVPDTDGLAEQKEASLRGIELWWYNILTTHYPRHSVFGQPMDVWHDTYIIRCEELRASYDDFCRSSPHKRVAYSDNAFGRALRRVLGYEKNKPDPKEYPPDYVVRKLDGPKGGQYSVYVFPPIDTARAVWYRRFGFKGW
jgi:hypothetical protein